MVYKTEDISAPGLFLHQCVDHGQLKLEKVMYIQE